MCIKFQKFQSWGVLLVNLWRQKLCLWKFCVWYCENQKTYNRHKFYILSFECVSNFKISMKTWIGSKFFSPISSKSLIVLPEFCVWMWICWKILFRVTEQNQFPFLLSRTIYELWKILSSARKYYKSILISAWVTRIYFIWLVLSIRSLITH